MPPTDELYDPAEHSNAEVLDYLDAADADERERVLDAERNGRARVGILREFDDDGSAATDSTTSRQGELVAWAHTDPTTNLETGGAGIVIGHIGDQLLVLPTSALTRIPVDAVNANVDD